MLPDLVLIHMCDNCVPGDSSPYNLPLILVAAAGLILAAGILLLSQGTTKARALGIVAALFLGAGLPGAVALSHLPVSAAGAICGNALDASLERGVPGDSALDATQTACKERGTTVVRYATYGATGALLIGALTTVAAGRALRQRDNAKDSPARATLHA